MNDTDTAELGWGIDRRQAGTLVHRLAEQWTFRHFELPAHSLLRDMPTGWYPTAFAVCGTGVSWKAAEPEAMAPRADGRRWKACPACLVPSRAAERRTYYGGRMDPEHLAAAARQWAQVTVRD